FDMDVEVQVGEPGTGGIAGSGSEKIYLKHDCWKAWNYICQYGIYLWQYAKENNQKVYSRRLKRFGIELASESLLWASTTWDRMDDEGKVRFSNNYGFRWGTKDLWEAPARYSLYLYGDDQQPSLKHDKVLPDVVELDAPPGTTFPDDKHITVHGALGEESVSGNWKIPENGNSDDLIESLTAPAGQQLSNTNKATIHFNPDVTLQTGDRATVVFTASAEGTYPASRKITFMVSPPKVTQEWTRIVAETPARSQGFKFYMTVPFKGDNRPDEKLEEEARGKAFFEVLSAQGGTTQDATFEAKDASYTSRDECVKVYADLKAYTSGTYTVKVGYNGTVLRETTVEATTVGLAFQDAPAALTGETQQGDPYAVLPLSRYVEEGDGEATNTQATVTLVPTNSNVPIKAVKLPDKDENLLAFGDFVGVSRGQNEEAAQIVLEPTQEGEGDFRRTNQEGYCVVKCERHKWDKTKNKFKTKHLDRKVSIEPLLLICPDLEILRPSGDPGNAIEADQFNEVVFDDNKCYFANNNLFTGEPNGECFIFCESSHMSALSQNSRNLVAHNLEWSIEELGDDSNSVAATANKFSEITGGGFNEYNPAGGADVMCLLRYHEMPQKYDDFGKKTITMRLGGEESPWNYYQDVELFFHAEGTGNPGGQDPNWFYYWKQIEEPDAAQGNPQLQFEEGVVQGGDASWQWLGAGNGSRVRIEGPDKNGVESLAHYVGMLAHEQQHEDDFFEVIWAVDDDGDDEPDAYGYQNNLDQDNDGLRDDWEATQVMQGSNDWGPWTFDVPGGADGDDPDKDDEVWAETIKDPQGDPVISWSDERADNAAKAAVNADTEINKKDWSDLDVDAKRYKFYDSDGGHKE
ncbi:MAG: hypothetical protein KGY39_09495, partial [Anaerolineales bacterium]|nr:hypothetical protein [Anaerolineales bacterium]